MLVTARLSRLFYDRLGEAVANELVDWFNQVDASYRSDLRELNELNFARFDAKLDQRTAELRGDLSVLEARLSAKIDSKVDAAIRDQTRFLFVAWAALLAPIIGLWFR